MTLNTLIFAVGGVAAVLTLLVGFVFKSKKNWLISFLQNYTGALFIFSGWVKAIDPLGTAYKMEQYFAEFEATFSETLFSFLAPMFPFLAGFAIYFSVFTIVFEIVLGVMLLVGSKPKFTSWAFFLLVAFFTFLTGFTYLTGYVPQGVNFFSFSEWGDYVETNMKVTDCGCFGDFLKLKPKVSFIKDLALMVPAILFLFKHRDMHQLWTSKARTGIVLATLAGVSLFSFSNFAWDLPGTDFRPFKNGVNIAQQLQAEQEAAENVEII
ncbi:MAG: MauE/DoxX family redox-associated membrane protein, partial [Bacteroidota bacterium]